MIGRWWCRMFHGRPFWPIHGRYICRREARNRDQRRVNLIFSTIWVGIGTLGVVWLIMLAFGRHLGHDRDADEVRTNTYGVCDGTQVDGRASRQATLRDGLPSPWLFVLEAGNNVSRTVEAAKALFVIAEVARKNFALSAERRAAVEKAFCALAGKPRPDALDRKLIARELAK